jgi:3-hydroxyacyl-CoA dehydrogenase
VRRVAVLGAGVMGAQIAAHFVNAGVPALLFDLASRDGSPNALAAAGIARLLKLEPAPLAARERAVYIDAANYDSDLSRLSECDLVIEAVGERLDWKRDLYARIAPCMTPRAVLASNTSGLSLAALAEVLPANMRARFCGMHFFNPPRSSMRWRLS